MVPEKGMPYVSDFMDQLLALNYSSSTLRTYSSSFIQFLRHFNYENPELITQKQVVKFLGSLMEQGLSATSGHSMVNSLQFYYKQVLGKSSFEISIPRPKKRENYLQY